jgi:arginine:ornithine antiporter/lysine permease
MSTTEINIPIREATATASTKLRLGSLTALVIGSMVGSGVFSLPQNMAAGAGPLAILIGWAITAIGMLALVFVYQSLAVRRPELDAGPYAYAKAGFGPFIGFNSAWGYWISAWVGNVSYAVIVFSALSYFFPAFGDGNTWQAVLGASILLWVIHFLVLTGIRQAAIVNTIVTVAKIAPVVLFVGIVAVAFKLNVWTLDFTGLGNASLGTIAAQVKSTMLVTLWVFIDIEGARNRRTRQQALCLKSGGQHGARCRSECEQQRKDQQRCQFEWIARRGRVLRFLAMDGQCDCSAGGE